jgi:hypothetical protein
MFEGAAARRPFFFAVRGARAVRVRRLKPPWDARLRPGTAEARCPSRGLAPALETGFHVGIGDDIDLRLRSWNPKCVLTIGRLLLEIPQRGRYNSALRALRRPPPQAHSGRAVAQGFDPGIQTTLGPPFGGPFSVVRAGRFARLTPPCDARLPRGTAESPSPRLRRHWAAPASARDRLSHSDRGRGQSEASRASSSRRWSNSRPRH